MGRQFKGVIEMRWMIRMRRVFSVVGREALMLCYALRNPGTPTPIRLATVLLAAYLVSPIDLVPDFAMLFGWADDLMLLLVAVPFLAKRLPPAVFADAAARAERWFGRPATAASGRYPGR